MKMYSQFIASALLVIVAQSSLYAQESIKTTASLKEVTVYKSGVAMEHTAKVTIPAGSSEIIINNVATYINENSIQISAPAHVTIMSVMQSQQTFSANEASTNPEYLAKANTLKDAEKKLKLIQTDKESTQATLNMLNNNQTVGGSNTGLSVAELTKMADYFYAKQKELKEKNLALIDQEVEQNKLVQKLRTELGQIQNGGISTGGQLVVQVMATQPTTANLNVNYLSPNASWTAAYDLRADNTKDPLKILYKANVTQSTGIDWKKVKLTLSTGNPSQGGNAPQLSTWFLRYYTPSYGARDKKSEYYTDQKAKSRKELSDMNPDIGYALEGAAPGLATNSNYGGVDGYTEVSQNTVTTNFDIDIPYDIASNNKTHSVTLKEYKHPADYKFYAVPKLDCEVYLIAELTDYQKLDLVPGEANIIFENMYVGKTYVNPDLANDTLILSMGNDKRITVKRDKIADMSGDKFIGSNVTKTYTYEITVRNNKNESIELSLKDQYPIATDEDITIELLKSDNADVNKETGELAWKLNVPAGQSKKVRFSYSVKYPKGKTIGNL